MTPQAEPWTLGVLFSLSGHMAIPSQQHVCGAELAVAELNDAGGVLGRPLATRKYDTRSDLALYRQYVDRLLTHDGVRTLIGCCTSLSRKVVLPSIERRDALLLYPDLYEGFEYSPNVLYGGAATNQNTLPLARYLLRSGARRFMLVGSDYVYPREANRVMRDLIERHGAQVVDEAYLPIQGTPAEVAGVVDRIAELQPDIVFNTLVGRSICDLLEAFTAAGIDERTVIASHNVTEAELRAVETPPAAGHITSAPYFDSLPGAPSQDFVRAFRHRFGADAPVSQYAAAAYAAVHLFARALEMAGEMDTRRIVNCAHGLWMDAPQGRISVDEDNNHTWMTPRIGRWNGRDAFDIVWQAQDVAQPDPWLVHGHGIEAWTSGEPATAF